MIEPLSSHRSSITPGPLRSEAALREAVLHCASQEPSATRKQRASVLFSGSIVALAVVGALVWLPGGREGLYASGGGLRIIPAVLSLGLAMLCSGGLLYRELSPCSHRILSILDKILSVQTPHPLRGVIVLTGLGLLSIPLVTAQGSASAEGMSIQGLGRCCSAFFVMASLVLIPISRGLRREDLSDPVLAGAAVGISVGAWVGLLLQLRCTDHGTGHQLLGHVAPVALLSLLAGGHRAWLRLRAGRLRWGRGRL